MPPRAFILGGTGQIGRAAADHFLNQGWDVTISHRGSSQIPPTLIAKGAKVVSVSRENTDELHKAIGSGADILFDTTAYDTNHAEQLLDIQNYFGSFIVISSCSVYRDEAGRTLDEAAQNGFPDIPYGMRETQATVEPGPANYSTRKIALERKLLDDSKIPISILRPCAIYGVGSTHPREWWFAKRMLDGRIKIPLAFDGASQFHTCAAQNIASLALVCAQKPQTHVLNIADPSAPSVSEIGQIIGRHMNYKGQFIKAPSDGVVGHTPWSTPKPFVLDCSAALALGYKPAVDYRDGIRPMVEWLMGIADQSEWRKHFPELAGYPNDHFDYETEDKFLEAFRTAT